MSLNMNVSNIIDDKLRISRGGYSDISKVNKFGRSTNVDSGTATDLWDGANATDDIDVWVAPTQARTHQIASTSANDDGDPAGTGAQTIRIFGLTDWDTKEVSEDITMNGVSNVATSNQYVIIHRMVVLAWGSAGPNVGTITATADTDSTVTAQINAGFGQTQMCVYGIPSVQDAYLTEIYTTILRANLGTSEAHADMTLFYNSIPDTVTTGFITKETWGCGTRAPSLHPYNPYFKLEGPGIIKIQATGSANNLDVSGNFDLILVDK